MTEEWVKFWYQALSANMDYAYYCSAVEQQDIIRQRALEAKFPKIAEIYQDFGELISSPFSGARDDPWDEWFQPRQHLFMTRVQEITPGSCGQDQGYVNLKVPLREELNETHESVKRFLTELYQSRSITPAPKPKYQLLMRGRRIACGYEQVRQAIHTSTVSYALNFETYEYQSIRDAILQYVLHELPSTGWSIDEQVYKELKEQGTMNDDDYEGFRVMVNKCRRDFKALSQNTVRGRFPDLTPFDSEVIDQFWGE